MGQLVDRLEGLVRGLGAPDDLHQLHHGGGVEEVHPDELVRPLGGGGDGGDGDGGGVGCLLYTSPLPGEIEAAESQLDIDAMVEAAYQGIERIKLDYQG